MSDDLHSLPNGTWQSWFDAYGRKLLLFARQWATRSAGAEDIVQEAFVRFWRSPHRDDAAAHLHLFSMVRRVGLDHLRATTRRTARETAADLAPEAEASWFAPATDERDATLQAALQQLPQEQREVVVLKIWGELTFEQIARTLDIPANTAASRYRYALEALRRTISPIAS